MKIAICLLLATLMPVHGFAKSSSSAQSVVSAAKSLPLTAICTSASEDVKIEVFLDLSNLNKTPSLHATLVINTRWGSASLVEMVGPIVGKIDSELKIVTYSYTTNKGDLVHFIMNSLAEDPYKSAQLISSGKQTVDLACNN